ncbi:MAG: nicotinate-nucleotide--dimethylbenzimidazole phosphoribosyltransferase [Bacteroidales bacterium]
MNFKITKPDEAIKEKLIDKINNLTKPKGSLGMLEEIALQIGLIQQTLLPTLRNPHNILYAADHGVVVEGVSFSPKEVTWQQIGNFLKGGAGINFLCRQHGFQLKIVDAGVDFDFPDGCGVIDLKVAKGTKNYVYEPAMTMEQMELAIERGAQVVRQSYDQGCNIVSFGEMGIANTSSSSLWMHYFTGIPLRECVGAGSGLSNSGIEHKYKVLKRAVDHYEQHYKGSMADSHKIDLQMANENLKALEIIAYFGGLEMVMAVGGMLQAAELKMTIMIDGFIMTNCILAAKQLYPAAMDYAIFGHVGDETGHKLVLQALGAKPILNLGLRLGEGSGAICAYPIIDSAVRMIHEMDSFAGASVTKYFI